jgi:hypothetical protein
LHRWALSADLSTAKEWLDRFAGKIPCGDCRRHWLAETQSNPPPLNSPGDLFAWTVARHNAVNRRLGKPEIALNDARVRWDKRADSIHDLTRYFDAIWCINLDTDTQRWATFQKQLAASNWPFRPVTRFPAIHGDTVGVPDHFHQGGGAWGCLQSHRRVLELSRMAGHQRILIMEDDVDLRPTFGHAATKFLSDLGDHPWDCLMFGGQHMSPPKPLKPGLVRATNTQRTHCFALSSNFLRELYRFWSSPIDLHCDWALGPFAARFNTFAPERFIAGQRGGHSQITGNAKPPEWWNPPNPNAPVVFLRCPRDVLESSRDLFHAGNRRNEHGICLGLADVFNPQKHPTDRDQIAALKGWISMIQWEVESRSDGSVCTIWHPGANPEIVRPAAGKVLLEIDAATQDQARHWHATHCTATDSIATAAFSP